MAASIYAATRILGSPASVREFTFGVSVREAMGGYWALRQYLDLKVSVGEVCRQDMQGAPAWRQIS
jgi:hypothetical protein